MIRQMARKSDLGHTHDCCLAKGFQQPTGWLRLFEAEGPQRKRNLPCTKFALRQTPVLVGMCCLWVWDRGII